MSLTDNNNNNNKKTGYKDDGGVNNLFKADDLEEKASMDSEEVADLYRIDELKRRKVYQWNRQQPFAYSNKID